MKNLTKTAESRLPTISLIAEKRKKFVPFSRALVQNEHKLSQVEIELIDSIFDAINSYVTCTFKYC